MRFFSADGLCPVVILVLLLISTSFVQGQEKPETDTEQAARGFDVPGISESARQLIVPKYAENLMIQFDSNKDGLIDKSEQRKMSSQLTAADGNSDGNLSVDEIVNYLDSIKKKAETNSSLYMDSRQQRIDKYATGLLNQYDVNNDGFIDAEEAKKMRRAPRILLDADSDGKFSKEELIAAITGTTPPAFSAAIGSLTQSSDPRVVRRRNAETPAANPPRTAYVEFELIELSPDASPKEFNELVSQLNQADRNVDSLVEKIVTHGDVTDRDSIALNVVSKKSVSLHSGGRVIIPTGVHVNSRSSRSNSYSTENLGLQLKIKPEIVGDQVSLFFEASKSGIEEKPLSKTSSYDIEVKGQVSVQPDTKNNTIVLSGNSNDLKKVEDLISQTSQSIPTIKTFEFQSTILCSDGQASAALLFEADRKWLVIVRADVN